MGIFNQLFHSGHAEPALSDYSALAVDIHSHLIPGIDDGSDRVETSLEMLKGFQELGFKKMITTPHVMSDFYKNSPATILPGLEIVRNAAEAAGLTITLEVAAEYNIDDGFEKKMGEGNLMTFGDNYVLIELNTYMPHPNLHTILFNLQLDGYKVILAHAERYSYWYNDPKGYEELRDREVLFQVNIGSFVNNNKQNVKKMAEKLATLDMIDFLGSDIHNPLSMPLYRNALSDKSVIHLINSGRLLNNTLL